MKHIKHIETYSQPSDTGEASAWEKTIDNTTTRVTLKEIIPYLETEREMPPQSIQHLLIDTQRDPRRVAHANLEYPIILLQHKGKHTAILDGHHRVVKAIDTGETLKARTLNLDDAPENIARVFG